MRRPLSGVFAPVVTPFENGELRPDYLEANLRRLGATRLAGYLALGSNGEFRAVSEAERARILEVFAETKGDKIVMAGASAESTAEAARFARQAAELEFEYASVLPPSYFAKHMTSDVLYRFFSHLADASPIPIVLYNAPQFTGGVQIGVSTAVRLSSHPNIAGIKDSSKAGPGAILASLPEDRGFAVLAGSTSFFYPALHLGADGGVLSLANAIPESCVELYELFRDGRFPEALKLHTVLHRLNQAVSGSYGVAGVKAAVSIAGMQGGEPRQPIAPLGHAERHGIESAIRGAGLLEE